MFWVKKLEFRFYCKKIFSQKKAEKHGFSRIWARKPKDKARLCIFARCPAEQNICADVLPNCIASLFAVVGRILWPTPRASVRAD
jgi:hypothetical protein